MRVLLISSGDYTSTYGGGQVYVKNLAEELVKCNCVVAVVSVIPSICEPRIKKYNGVTVFEMPSSSFIEKAVSDFNPDIIHAHGFKSLSCKTGNKMGIPVIVTAHHGGIVCPAGALLKESDEICNSTVSHKNCLKCVLRDIPGYKTIWYPLMHRLPEKHYLRIGQWLHKQIFIPFLSPVGSAALSINNKILEWNGLVDNCALMIAPCKQMADVMLRNGLIPDKIKIVPHGIPLPTTRPVVVPMTGTLKFFYVGRLSFIKGIHILLDTFSKIETSDVELHLIGTAATKNERRYFKKLRKKFLADSRIIWHGKVDHDEIYKMTSQFHVGIAPSICLEVFGLNISEALSLGKPVIASRSGGGEMQIIPGYNGWLVNPNDSRELLNVLNGIIQHPDVINQLARNCNATSIKEHVCSLLGIYEEVLGSYQDS